MGEFGELSERASKAEATLLVLFIPSADREGDALTKKQQKGWVRQPLRLLGETLGGATAFPRGWGVWRDDAQNGRLVWDKPVLIQCFTTEEALKHQANRLRDFLVEMGRETNQGAVGFVIDQTFFQIHFPPPKVE
jgi:hypothetical protein